MIVTPGSRRHRIRHFPRRYCHCGNPRSPPCPHFHRLLHSLPELSTDAIFASRRHRRLCLLLRGNFRTAVTSRRRSHKALRDTNSVARFERRTDQP